MKLNKLDHIGIAVTDLDKAIETYKAIGFDFETRTRIDEMGIEIAFFNCGDSKIELLQGLRDDSAISKHIEKKGEGIQHLCFETEDFDKSIEYYKEKGFAIIGKPVIGAEGKRIYFLHPKATNRVLIEIIEKGDPQ